MHKMAEEMVAGLASMGQPAEAAAVALQQLNDVDGAVSLLAQARHWRSALHTAYRCGRGVFSRFPLFCELHDRKPQKIS